MYDTILLPTDGSVGAEAAIDHALHLADQNDATVHAVHVVAVTDYGDLTEVDEDEEKRAFDVLDPVLEAVEEAGIEVVEEVLEGTPNERLVEYADHEDVDMIVMGTHGKSGVSRVLLGSTAEKVVRNSPVPVLTVRD